MNKNYNKIDLSRLWKCCYTYILTFLRVQRFIPLFLIALRTQFPHRYLVLPFYLRFDQIGNKLQQPFRNQRHKFTDTQNVNITSNIFDHVHEAFSGAHSLIQNSSIWGQQANLNYLQDNLIQDSVYANCLLKTCRERLLLQIRSKGTL